jgi:hypothetical protein
MRERGEFAFGVVLGGREVEDRGTCGEEKRSMKIGRGVWLWK